MKMSLFFIVAYVLCVNIGTAISAQFKMPYLGQIILLVVLCAVLLYLCKKQNLLAKIGFTKIGLKDFKENLFYAPLIIMVLMNGVFFFDTPKLAHDVFTIVAFMALVAFLEEVLFRGLLFKAIEERKSTKAAVIISGLTFGFGHIVNLLNGYTGIAQIIQIVLAVVIGIVLSLLFVRTKSIVPGIVFHFFFNLASVLSIEVEPFYDYINVGIILVMAFFYLLYFYKTWGKSIQGGVG
ncbi:MAG: CPBP family intramembrane metalloprotease [Lachnospiraceae bacterium]|nr:CPBP family intramembrane metalloprotease [Lachnospiraceae bacterium]